ncbi:MAG: hypothetical protein OXP75_05715 [Rhodospirillales bacterium]|nr:hypothetical protein [Rhodospirillales bacterium]
MGRKRPDDSKSKVKKAKRSPHTIRFLEPEWEDVEAFAEARGLAPAEFVRFATLNAIADGGASVAGLAPLIQTTFRATHILASRLRDEMLGAGEQEVLEEMIAAARGLQTDLIESK